MIKVVLTIEEERPGVIRFRGLGENEGEVTKLEAIYCTEVMKAVEGVKANFTKQKSIIPLTIITTTENKDEHKNRSRS
jgi:hypothetical protein